MFFGSLPRRALVNPLITNIPARKKIIEIAAGYIKTLIDTVDEIDEVETGFGKDIIKQVTEATERFEDYLERNKDTQEALKIILNNEDEPITKEMLEGLESAIKSEIEGFSTKKWWRYYALLNPESVTMLKSGDEVNALTNLIQLVRYAYRRINYLCSVPSICARLFNLWCGQIQRQLTDKQKVLFAKVASYVAQNGSVVTINSFRNDPAFRDALRREMGSMEAANDAVRRLSMFLLNRKVV